MTDPIRLLVTIVEHGKGERITNLANARHVHFNFILHGRGTASSDILDMLGLGSTEKDVVVCALPRSRVRQMLHDVAEDTGFSVEDIRARFGDRIASLVAAESENKREKLPAEATWSIRKQETITHLQSTASIEVKMIALGDKLSNIRAIYRDQLAIGDALWERFHQKDKAQHKWYYSAIADALSELKVHPAWQEYHALVQKVFGE